MLRSGVLSLEQSTPLLPFFRPWGEAHNLLSHGGMNPALGEKSCKTGLLLPLPTRKPVCDFLSPQISGNGLVMVCQ